MLNKKSDLFIYGKHPVIAALNNPRRQCKNLYTTKEIWQNIQNKFSNPKFKIHILNPKELNDKFSNELNHQNIILEALPLSPLDIEDIISQIGHQTTSCLIILDQVTDPHNIGAIIRSAAAFSADAVILTEHNSPKENNTIIKCAAGACEIVPMVKVTNLSNCIRFLKQNNYWIIGMDGHTDLKLNSSMFSDKVAIILGSEESGIRRLTRENCDYIAKINISNQAESLNVSNAAAIALYELSQYRK